MPKLLEKERTVGELAKLMQVSRSTARRRLLRLGVLRRHGRRGWWVTTLAELKRVMPGMFYGSQPNRDELQQLQHEITDLRREMRRTRAESRRVREELERLRGLKEA